MDTLSAYRRLVCQVLVECNSEFCIISTLDESDGTLQYVCGNNECGHIALSDRHGAMRCPVCGNNANIHPIQTSYAFKLLLDELLSLDIGFIFSGTIVEPYRSRIESLKDRSPHKVGVDFRTDSAKTHTTLAGSDLLLLRLMRTMVT